MEWRGDFLSQVQSVGELVGPSSTQNSNPLLSFFVRTKAFLDLYFRYALLSVLSEEFTLLDPPPDSSSRRRFKFFILTFLFYFLSIFSPLHIILYSYQCAFICSVRLLVFGRIG